VNSSGRYPIPATTLSRPVGDDRRGGELLREAQRVVQRDEHRGDVDAHALRARGDRGGERGRRRHVAVVDAVMLRDRDRVEAEPVGPFAHVETRRVLSLDRRTGERRHAQVEPQADERSHRAISIGGRPAASMQAAWRLLKKVTPRPMRRAARAGGRRSDARVSRASRLRHSMPTRALPLSDMLSDPRLLAETIRLLVERAGWRSAS
jgi:hypothetical protein